MLNEITTTGHLVCNIYIYLYGARRAMRFSQMRFCFSFSFRSLLFLSSRRSTINRRVRGSRPECVCFTSSRSSRPFVCPRARSKVINPRRVTAQWVAKSAQPVRCARNAYTRDNTYMQNGERTMDIFSNSRHEFDAIIY